MKTRGINHLAMVTNDMEKTVRFYREVMGFPLVAAIGGNPNGLRARHYFFETGANSTIAFFEWEGAEDFHKPAGLEAAGRIQFDHVSFDVETEDELLELQKRLNDAGQGVTTVIDHKFIHSIYFHDFSGIALEASVWITNSTGKAPDYSNKNVFADPNPVPALQEEMDKARLVESS
ncbi:MAG: VOC family protein [Dehalococcoidia bacterium]|nr:VOC family protein [Dehalococcoidia bacterium]